ncbi:MAG TPA: TraB/GumN family protein [Verrucomicrobiae bacterium]|nr:TraB/GumN family protein [Verrucomicrobiae bacterium]
MHTRVLVFALAILGLAGHAFSQTNSPAGNLHSLWRAEGKSNVVYLMGSVHLLKPSDYPLDPVLELAYTNSTIVVFETDIERMQRPTTQFEMMSKAALPPGETLKDQLSEKVYQDFRKRVEAAGLPGMMFDQLKPSLAAMTLAVVELQKLGVDPELGIDQHFFNRARKDRKPIVPLETVEFQIDLITGFSKAEGEDFMKSLLEQIDQTEKVFDEMVSAWKTGNTEMLEKVLNESMRDAPGIYSKFLTDRNRRWLPEVQKLIDSGTNSVVIVGAGHLVGPDGLVDLLQKRGAKLKQL